MATKKVFTDRVENRTSFVCFECGSTAVELTVSACRRCGETLLADACALKRNKEAQAEQQAACRELVKWENSDGQPVYNRTPGLEMFKKEFIEAYVAVIDATRKVEELKK